MHARHIEAFFSLTERERVYSIACSLYLREIDYTRVKKRSWSKSSLSMLINFVKGKKDV